MHDKVSTPNTHRRSCKRLSALAAHRLAGFGSGVDGVWAAKLGIRGQIERAYRLIELLIAPTPRGVRPVRRSHWLAWRG